MMSQRVHFPFSYASAVVILLVLYGWFRLVYYNNFFPPALPTYP